MCGGRPLYNRRGVRLGPGIHGFASRGEDVQQHVRTQRRWCPYKVLVCFLLDWFWFGRFTDTGSFPVLLQYYCSHAVDSFDSGTVVVLGSLLSACILCAFVRQK